ncbi:Protein LigF [compost metagenome]
MELYYSGYSINSEKVLLCLFEKEINFEGHYINLFNFDQTDPSYLRVNPLGLTPTLKVGRTSIPESTIINEYLEEAFPGVSLRPEDPFERAQMRGLVQTFQDRFHPSMALISQVHFVADEMRRRWTIEQLEEFSNRKPNPERAARQIRAVRDGLTKEEVSYAERTAEQMLDAMEAQLSLNSEWLLRKFSLADLSALPNVHRFFQLGLDHVVMKRPNVFSWYERMCRRPSFARTYEFAYVDFDVAPSK